MWIIFKYQKFSLRVLLRICLGFCQFQPGVAYKSVAYKKKACKRYISSSAYVTLRSWENASVLTHWKSHITKAQTFSQIEDHILQKRKCSHTLKITYYKKSDNWNYSLNQLLTLFEAERKEGSGFNNAMCFWFITFLGYLLDCNLFWLSTKFICVTFGV